VKPHVGAVIGAGIVGTILANAACSPAVDALRARRDKEEALVSGSVGPASACVADAAERAGARILETKHDIELGITELAVSFPKAPSGGTEFNAWYEFSPRDGRSARVVHTFDAAVPDRDAARQRALGPLATCGAGTVR